MADRTAWFPPEIKPVRVGLYERELSPGEIYRQLWTGKAWHFQRHPKIACSCQDLFWRGLAAPSDQPKDDPQ